VQAIAVQTLRGVADRELIDAFEGRLLALSKAHSLLGRKQWDAVGLRDVVDQILQPFGLNDRRAARFSVAGDDVHLHPNTALTLAMVFHELATNAAKSIGGDKCSTSGAQHRFVVVQYPRITESETSASRTTELDCGVEASFNVMMKIHGSIDPHGLLDSVRLSNPSGCLWMYFSAASVLPPKGSAGQAAEIIDDVCLGSLVTVSSNGRGATYQSAPRTLSRPPMRPACVRVSPGKEDGCSLKPFFVTQRVRRPPGKGGARQPEGKALPPRRL
jgi:hypothetical protein